MYTKPTLLVMAAGLGSRYGGLKQMDPIGPTGELIIDYSLFDAHSAGFERAVIVINRKNEADFKEIIGNRAAKYMQIDYAFQDLNDIPEGASIPEGREKPWGTGHAVYAARDLISGPFAVINADDYYGPEAFKALYGFLSSTKDDAVQHYCMVNFLIENTLSESGTVSRGVCEADGNGLLTSITERTKIRKAECGGEYTEDGTNWIPLLKGTPVSMNCFGFSSSFMDEICSSFVTNFDDIVKANPLKGEFFLPSVVSALIANGKADVRQLISTDKWYGVTYKEDRPLVVEALSGRSILK